MRKGGKRPDGHIVEHGVYLMTRADRLDVGRKVETGRLSREAAMSEYGVGERTVQRWQREWRSTCSEAS